MLSLRDIEVDGAAARIAPFVARTPVLTFDALDEWIGANVLLKCEHLQRAGAFKYRGATNAVQALPAKDAFRGVAAHSSGNHAAALALAARVRGIPAYVVMPEATSHYKVANVARSGAEIVWCDNTLDARRARLSEVIARTGAVEIHPFENVHVIAGAGTAARELLDDAGPLDVVVTPVGGGGLCAGTAAALHGVGAVRVIGAAPGAGAQSIADGLRTGTSPATDALLRDANVERVTVSDDAIATAMRSVWERTKQSIEPSAAIAFAAARAAGLAGARVGIICSGGNVDLDALPWG